MALISERAGVNRWLVKQHVRKNERQQRILSDYKTETGISFYRTWVPGPKFEVQKIASAKRFQSFTKWFNENKNRYDLPMVR